MECYFMPADILLPKVQSMEKWAVIACDQYTSEPEYWTAVDAFVGSAHSALRMIMPEYALCPDMASSIEQINAAMERYLADGIFKEYPNAFIYVERRLLNGETRCGIVGAVDLEHYNYGVSNAPIRATEETVVERIPLRVAVRRAAPIELSHVLLLCDDPGRCLVESVSMKKDSLPIVYDFELMAGGGHITGWLVSGQTREALQRQIQSYTCNAGNVVFAVGDGNHSLAAAKACYEDGCSELGRYALAELVNIHDSAIVFEPIHRIITGTNVDKLLNDISQICCADGTPLPWNSGERSGTLFLNARGRLPIAVLQKFLDQWLADNPGNMDYIHGDTAVYNLSMKSDSIGFILPCLDKSSLFPFVAGGGVLPRKAFSMGHAREKRYYLEGRRIK